ncbi:Na+/H+ antiporter NhaA [Xanthomarina sp. F2636L]|uniref:Na+/H+ antiporter NhaA n=1 Tax=Xanthomarina sp. F2636L TaxID=2996018 RepID=UPI00225E34ED|nr:Na+/H+ antiporter NhaA [Xanthomarina sp. F2636L]MCX7551179.1 Na+/H+ antiporter NhaA [Xanthomarina sp. F2636L]
MTKNAILTPLQKFIKIESLSGFLLLGATLLALLWANSPWSHTYQELWQYELGFTSETFEIDKPLILWINDGLMAVFFFLIGLEIKREFLIGELNSTKKLAFPLVGAIGGMAFPVMFYFIFNQNPETTHGWGVPMATDIAFALAVLNILGNRVPLSLKLFLMAFAIVDDIGAVLVIAIFYSGSIEVSLLLIALGMLALLYFISYKGLYLKYLFLVFGVVIWILFLKSGIHPTLAGILLAFSVPIQQNISTKSFVNNLETITKNLKEASILQKPILSTEQIAQMDNLQDWTNKYQSPLQQLEHKLHDWVAFIIIPIFALANAGVAFDSAYAIDWSLVVTLMLSLILGNSVGVTTIVLLANKIKLITIPSDINKTHIVGVAFLAGIGFTMAIFIASLAFRSTPAYVDSAKIGILLGSLVSAIIGYFILRYNSNRPNTVTRL